MTFEFLNPTRVSPVLRGWTVLVRTDKARVTHRAACWRAARWTDAAARSPPPMPGVRADRSREPRRPRGARHRRVVGDPGQPLRQATVRRAAAARPRGRAGAQADPTRRALKVRRPLRSRRWVQVAHAPPVPLFLGLLLLADQIAELIPSAEVPIAVCGQFERLKNLCRAGLFTYESFTHAERDAYRVLKVALKVRFVQHYANGLPLVNNSGAEQRPVSSWRDVQQLLGRTSAVQPLSGSSSGGRMWSHIGMANATGARGRHGLATQRVDAHRSG